MKKKQRNTYQLMLHILKMLLAFLISGKKPWETTKWWCKLSEKKTPILYNIWPTSNVLRLKNLELSQSNLPTKKTNISQTRPWSWWLDSRMINRTKSLKPKEHWSIGKMEKIWVKRKLRKSKRTRRLVKLEQLSKLYPLTVSSTSLKAKRHQKEEQIKMKTMKTKRQQNFWMDWTKPCK